MSKKYRKGTKKEEGERTKISYMKYQNISLLRYELKKLIENLKREKIYNKIISKDSKNSKIWKHKMNIIKLFLQTYCSF